jgi:DNA-directed DNA polymerase
MRLVIIDGNSLLFRAYFAMRPMMTKEGVYTHGVYAFINMLNKILGDYTPDYIAVCFDMKAKTFRHKQYEEYKAGRQQTPIELLSQIPLMHDVLDAMNISVFEKETYEADDLIGTITAEASRRGIESIIITGDKDELQLIDKNTKVVINKKGMTEFDIYDEAAMIDRYSLTPKQFIDLKGLMGDKSDNIPGVPGIGEKKGIALLKEYGSVEGVLENADKIKGKLGENVRANKEMATLSKSLATIRRDVPLDYEFDDLKFVKPNYDELLNIYRILEFNSLIKKLDSSEHEAVTEIKKSGANIFDEYSKYKHVDPSKFYDRVSSGSDVVITFKGDNNHSSMPMLDSVSLLSAEEKIITKIELSPLNVSSAIETLISRRYEYICYDIKPFIYTLLKYNINGLRIQHDVFVAEYLLDPNRSRYSLDKMLVKYTDFTFDESTDDSVHLLYILKVYEGQKKGIDENGLTTVYEECELPLIETMAAMESIGMKVDRAVLESVGIELDARIIDLENSIYEKAGQSFNIKSPKQLGVVLFEDMGIPYPGRGKKKTGYSTSVDVLEKLRDEQPIVNDILEYRKATKLKSTYIEGLIALIADDGKIHPHFNQTVAATGRISCTEPNLQNIPIRDEYGRYIRKAFVTSDENHTFIGADYSQIELRILAALSGDESLINAFNNNEDIHRITASRVFNVPLDQVTPLDRSRAKAVNFGVIYGMSGFGLSEELMISRAEAQRYIDDYFLKHTSVKAYLDEQIKIGERDYAVKTIMGRIRQIPEFASRKYMDRQFANRLAMNTPIQGSAADIIKLAMNSVYLELKDRNLKSKLVLQIHDELIIEADNDELEIVKELLRRNMEKAFELKVKLVCDMHTGSTWYDLK